MNNYTFLKVKKKSIHTHTTYTHIYISDVSGETIDDGLTEGE